MPNFQTGGLVLLAIILVFAVALILSRKPHSLDVRILNSGSEQPEQDRSQISVASWNLGYAGLGAESDFFADGGSMSRAPSQQAAENNLDGIVHQLGEMDVDVLLLQEVSGPSYLNRGMDLVGAISSGMPEAWLGYLTEIDPPFLPLWIRPRLGKAIVSQSVPDQSIAYSLPGDGGRILGIIKRHYSAQTVILNNPSGPDWAIINIHLSAFDEGGEARFRQLEAVFDLGRTLEDEGYNVVIGGDWNLRLADTDFANTTGEQYLFWLHDFPEEKLPAGWQIVIDPAMPTVRTNERPYRSGENYTTIIDGFIVSPGVDVVAVEGLDLGFQHADHQPVVARFRAKP